MTDTRLVICCGLGGVGKTTTAAALGVAHARAGRRAIVMTIDPARRLADALGVEQLGNGPARVPLRDATGTLDALMLDRDATWAEVIHRHAPSAEHAERLIGNAWSRAAASRLSGAHELMATEKLHELVHTGAWDVVIVDTPPSHHALDFLHAPQRVRRLLDRRLLGAILEPGSTGLLGFATRGLATVVRRVAGEKVLDDLGEFFGMVGALSAGLRDRGAEIDALLSSPACTYVLVASASAPREDEVREFVTALREDGRRLTASALTRALPPLVHPAAALVAALPSAPAGVPAADWATATDALTRAVRAHAARAARDATSATALSAITGAPVWPVPDVPADLDALSALERIADALPVS